MTLKFNQDHWKRYEQVKLNEYCLHAKFYIYHIHSVQENHNVKFLIVWTFASWTLFRKFGDPEKNWANLICSELDRVLLHEPGMGSLTNCNTAVFRVQNTLLNMIWELFVKFDKSWVWLVGTQEPSCGREKKTRTTEHERWWECSPLLWRRSSLWTWRRCNVIWGPLSVGPRR